VSRVRKKIKGKHKLSYLIRLVRISILFQWGIIRFYRGRGRSKEKGEGRDAGKERRETKYIA